jgi:hypothetical protein
MFVSENSINIFSKKYVTKEEYNKIEFGWELTPDLQGASDSVGVDLRVNPRANESLSESFSGSPLQTDGIVETTWHLTKMQLIRPEAARPVEVDESPGGAFETSQVESIRDLNRSSFRPVRSELPLEQFLTPNGEIDLPGFQNLEGLATINPTNYFLIYQNNEKPKFIQKSEIVRAVSAPLAFQERGWGRGLFPFHPTTQLSSATTSEQDAKQHYYAHLTRQIKNYVKRYGWDKFDGIAINRPSRFGKPGRFEATPLTIDHILATNQHLLILSHHPTENSNQAQLTLYNLAENTGKQIEIPMASMARVYEGGGEKVVRESASPEEDFAILSEETGDDSLMGLLEKLLKLLDMSKNSRRWS